MSDTDPRPRGENVAEQEVWDRALTRYLRDVKFHAQVEQAVQFAWGRSQGDGLTTMREAVAVALVLAAPESATPDAESSERHFEGTGQRACTAARQRASALLA